jgi:hypothetical protein
MAENLLIDAYKNAGLHEQHKEVIELWSKHASTHIMGSEEAGTVGVWITIKKPEQP